MHLTAISHRWQCVAREHAQTPPPARGPLATDAMRADDGAPALATPALPERGPRSRRPHEAPPGQLVDRTVLPEGDTG